MENRNFKDVSEIRFCVDKTYWKKWGKLMNWGDCGQLVSISSKFYAHIFCTKVLFSSYILATKSPFVWKTRTKKCWWNWLQVCADNLHITTKRDLLYYKMSLALLIKKVNELVLPWDYCCWISLDVCVRVWVKLSKILNENTKKFVNKNHIKLWLRKRVFSYSAVTK